MLQRQIAHLAPRKEEHRRAGDEHSTCARLADGRKRLRDIPLLTDVYPDERYS